MINLGRGSIVLYGHAGGVENRDLVFVFSSWFYAKQDLANFSVDVILAYEVLVYRVPGLAFFRALAD
ncbi:hypothetical protein CBM2599_A80068 [Cupriavidus taiwanensis]|nr:hypothetical protein CBM2599_A80068 [Cupriavidus taiwanensis]SOY92423.1 hypothetical protein CBM2600_A90067 [Cupriavidus taiwanensis]